MKKILLTAILTFTITALAIRNAPPEIKVVEVEKVTHEVKIEDAPAPEITCDTFEVADRIDCVDGHTGTNYGSFPIPSAEEEALNGKVDEEGLPTDSTSDDPAYRAPDGYFLTPCAEDEVPTIVLDRNADLPPGVWYTCIHIDQYGEAGEETYAWDPEAGHLVNN